MWDKNLGTKYYTILGSQPKGYTLVEVREIIAQGVKMSTSTQHCLKKSKAETGLA